MCFRVLRFIWNVIVTFIYIAIDVAVFFICSLSNFIESLEWPVIKTFYGIFRAIQKKLLEENKSITYSTGEYDFQVFQRGNEYIEDLLGDINDKLVGRSFIFEDKCAGFQNTRIIPFEGEIRLYYNVRMDYRIMRSGNCELRKEGKRVRVNANIKCCELYLNYFIHLGITSLTKTFNITGNIPYIEAYIEFSFNNGTSEDGQLTDFNIIEMFGTNLKFAGAGPLNFIPNFASKKLLKVFKRRVRTFLKEEMRSKLATLIETFKFPVASIPEKPEHSPQSERLKSISEESDQSPESTDLSQSSEEQRVSPEPRDGPDGENSSSSPEQQIQTTAVESSQLTSQDSSPELPKLIPLPKTDTSQSSDCNDTVETDCILEA